MITSIYQILLHVHVYNMAIAGGVKSLLVRVVSDNLWSLAICLWSSRTDCIHIAINFEGIVLRSNSVDYRYLQSSPVSSLVVDL